MATPNRDHMPLSHSAAQINPATSKTISRYLYTPTAKQTQVYPVQKRQQKCINIHYKRLSSYQHYAVHLKLQVKFKKKKTRIALSRAYTCAKAADDAKLLLLDKARVTHLPMLSMAVPPPHHNHTALP